MFARTRRLDGGVQREQVRLVCDLRDRVDDLADLLGILAERPDDLGGLLHRPLDLLHLRECLVHEARALLRRVRRLRRCLRDAVRLVGHVRDVLVDVVDVSLGGLHVLDLMIHVARDTCDRLGDVVRRLR